MKALTAALLLVLFIVLIGGTQTRPPLAPVQSQANGRYQIVINPNVRADTFLLDTQTGHIWRPVTITDVVDQPSIWKFDEKVDTDDEWQNWLTRQTYIKNPGTGLPK